MSVMYNELIGAVYPHISIIFFGSTIALCPSNPSRFRIVCISENNIVHKKPKFIHSRWDSRLIVLQKTIVLDEKQQYCVCVGRRSCNSYVWDRKTRKKSNFS